MKKSDRWNNGCLAQDEVRNILVMDFGIPISAAHMHTLSKNFEGSTAGLVSKVAGWEASWRSRCHVSVISKENVGPTPSVRRSALGIGFSLARTDACTVMNPLSSFEERTVRALPSSASQYASQPGSLLSLQYTSAGKAHSSATVRLHDIVRCGRCCRRPRCGCCAVYTTVYTHEIRSKLQLQSFICGRNESGGN